MDDNDSDGDDDNMIANRMMLICVSFSSGSGPYYVRVVMALRLFFGVSINVPMMMTILLMMMVMMNHHHYCWCAECIIVSPVTGHA